MTPKISSVYIFTIISTAFIAAGCQPNVELKPFVPPKIKLPYGNPDDGSDKKKPPKPAPSTPKEENFWELFLAFLDKSDGVPFDLKNSCAKEICGDPAGAQTPSNLLSQDLNSDPQAVQLYKTHFEPIFSRGLDLLVESRKKLLEKTRSSLPSISNLTLSKHETAIMNMLWTMENFSVAAKALSTSVDPMTLERKAKWDDERLKKELKSTLNENDYEYIKPLFLNLMASEEIQLSRLISEAPIPIALQLAYPNQTLEESRQKLVESIRTAVDGLKKAFPGLTFPELPSLELFAAGKDLDPDMVNNLTTAITFTYIYRITIQEPEIFNERPVSPKTFTEKYLNNEALSSVEASLQSSKLPVWRAGALAKCRANIINTYRTSPTPDDLKKAEAAVSTAREHALAVVAQELLLPEDQQVMVKDRITKLSFKFPLSRDQILNSHLRRAKNELRRSENYLVELEKAEASNLLISVYSNIINNGFVLTEKPLYETCEDYAPGGLTDHVITGFGHVGISWQSVRFLDLGLSVIAHEFGHVISAVLRKESSLDSLKRCLNSLHGNDQEINKDEEDFADWIAARVARRVRSTGSVDVGNIGCILMDHNSTRWGTDAGLTLRYPREVNQVSKDVHSTNFYRLLNFQTQSESQMPRSCETITDRYAPTLKHRCDNKSLTL